MDAPRSSTEEVGATNAGETFVMVPPLLRKASTIREISVSVGGGKVRHRAMCCLVVPEVYQKGCMLSLGFSFIGFMTYLTGK